LPAILNTLYGCFNIAVVGWRTRRRKADEPEPGPKNFSPEKYFRANPPPI
jgi:hypothetical protein